MTVVCPQSQKITLLPNTPYVTGGQRGPISIMIPTGTIATVYTTLGTAAEVEADTCEWMAWSHGAASGPILDTIVYQVAAIKIVSAAGGSAYLMRGDA